MLGWIGGRGLVRWGGEGVGDVGVWACLLAGGRRFVLNGLWMEGGEVVGLLHTV